jgi:hypothetical protein
MVKHFTKEQAKAIEDFLEENCFEIWNAGCTHRLQSNHSDEGFIVYDAYLTPVKKYKSLNAALDFMIKKDEL